MTRIKTLAATALVASAAFASAAPAFAVVPGSEYYVTQQEEQARLSVLQGRTADASAAAPRQGLGGAGVATYGYAAADRSSNAPLNNDYFVKQSEEADRLGVVTGYGR